MGVLLEIATYNIAAGLSPGRSIPCTTTCSSAKTAACQQCAQNACDKFKDVFSQDCSQTDFDNATCAWVGSDVASWCMTNFRSPVSGDDWCMFDYPCTSICRWSPDRLGCWRKCQNVIEAGISACESTPGLET